MEFMLSRQVVITPKGKEYFCKKVQEYKAIKPQHLFTEANGWYDETAEPEVTA